MKRLGGVLLILLLFTPVIAQDLTIRVGVYNNPPKIYVNETTGEVSGFHKVIIEEIADMQNWAIEYVIGTWNENLERLETGEIDVLVDVAYSTERAEKYDFNNESILDTWGVVYTKRGFNPTSILDLEGTRISVMRGSVHTTDFIKLLNEFDVTAELIEAENYTAVFELIRDGVADAGIANRLFGAAYNEEYQIETTNIIFDPVKLKYAMPKNATLNSIIIRGLDESIKYLKENKYNVYYTALNQMLGETYDIESLLILFYIIIAVISVMAIIIIVYLYASRREITLRMKAEDRLKESEARFYKTFEKAPVGIVILDTQGTILNANPKSEEITGYEKNKFIGKGLANLCQTIKIDVKTALEQFNEVKVNSIKTVEFVLTNKNGKKVDVLSTPAFIKEEKKIILLIEDITKRKENEAALIKKEEDFRKIFETSPELILVIDNTGKIIKINDRVNELSGYKKEDFIGKNIDSLPLTTESKTKAIKSFTKRMMGQNVEPYEIELIAKNNEIKTGLLRSGVIKDDNGQIVADLAMISDITKEKELESLKNNFVMLTTHDLKQPLMPILGYTDLLKTIVTDEKGKDYLNKITDSSYRMRDMVNKIINLFKIEEGKLIFNITTNNLSETINSVLNYKKSYITLKGIKIINKLDPKVKAEFDADRITDVFINLIDNATKFTANGGNITVKTWKTGSKAYASIKDNGVGIRKSEIENLFKKFYQSKEGKALGGSGIGLALVKKIIDAHNGKISVKSTYGKGTEFTVELPARK